MRLLTQDSNWKWPEIRGLHDFKGKLLHSARWDIEWDYSGASVAVIGAGSSGIQIVPKMQQGKLCPREFIFETLISTSLQICGQLQQVTQLDHSGIQRIDCEGWSKHSLYS